MTADEQIAVIRARADGKVIECKVLRDFDALSMWEVTNEEFDFFRFKYRVEPAADIGIDLYISLDTVCGLDSLGTNSSFHPNVSFTFDGETRVLKSVKMI